MQCPKLTKIDLTANRAIGKMQPRLLLLEDDRILIDMLRIALEPSFECLVAERLSSALGVIERNNLAVILADLGLQDSDGERTFERILEECGNIPVVVMTGGGNHYTALRALEYGCVDYIAKPFDVDRLAQRLEFAIARGRFLSTLRERLKKAEADKEAMRVERDALRLQLTPRTWLDANKTTILVAIITGIVTLIATLLARR